MQVSKRLQELLAQGTGRRSEEAKSGSEGHSPRSSGSKRERDDADSNGMGEGAAVAKPRPSFDVASAEGKHYQLPIVLRG